MSRAFWLCTILIATVPIVAQDGPPPREARGRHQPYGVLRVADEDHDGIVSEAEWRDFLARLAEDETGAVDHHSFAALVDAHRQAERRARRGEEGGALPPDFPLDEDGDGRFEIEDLEAIFAVVDRDGDGRLQSRELGPPPPDRRRPPRQ